MKIWANTIVNNEDRFIWFAIMSVIDYVDKVLIYDTGSHDSTIKIIEEIKKIKKNKIIIRKMGEVDASGLTELRQKMLEESDCDWIILLDGDEVWWDESIKKLVEKINREGQDLDAIVVPTMIPVGDIYHMQEEKAGQYQILGRKGHFNLRAINTKIPGLHVNLPHPNEGYFDNTSTPVQEKKRTIFLDAPYLHMTHLKRSTSIKIVDKFKHELGNKVGDSFRFPEVLNRSYPIIVPNPWIKISGTDLIKSKILTPLRKIKRRLIV